MGLGAVWSGDSRVYAFLSEKKVLVIFPPIHMSSSEECANRIMRIYKQVAKSERRRDAKGARSH